MSSFGGARPTGTHNNGSSSSGRQQSNFGPSGIPGTGFPKAPSDSNKFKPQPSASQRPFQPVEYTPEEHHRIKSLLDKVLGPEYVSSRPGGGGGKVSYIEGWRALNLANEVFGFNGWNSELINSQVDYFDTHGNSGRFSLGLSVVVRVTIKDGAYHEDFGYGFIDNAKSKAMAFEKCKKEAFTDGIKRCLRCFGNLLGNCLYDKTIISKIEKVKLPKPELEFTDFYRDPQLVESERRKMTSTKVNLLEKEATGTNANTNETARGNTNGNIGNVTTPNGSASNRKAATTPQSNGAHSSSGHSTRSAQSARLNLTEAEKVKRAYTPSAQEIEELDESFFSDDLMEDDMNLEDKEALPEQRPQDPNASLATAITEATQSAGFVSAAAAEKVQQPLEDITDLPQVNPNYVPIVPKNFAKAPKLDPTNSKSGPIKSQRPESASPTQGRSYPPSRVETNSLGKRIGMPPSQRPASKRFKDSSLDSSSFPDESDSVT